MNNDNKNESFDSLAHEKNISELYQNHKRKHGEEPSLKVDAEIMAIAQQQVSSNSKVKKHRAKHSENDKGQLQPKNIYSWRGPFSLVASVGILCILLITQRDYFIHPNLIEANDVSKSEKPIIFTPNKSNLETFKVKDVNEQPSRARQITVSVQKEQLLSDQHYAAEAKKSMSISLSTNESKEQLVKKSMLVNSLESTLPISKAEMSKLAELLKLELGTNNKEELDTNSKSKEMQLALYEHLSQYQKRQGEIKLSELFLNVLTEKQIKQLQSWSIETGQNK